MNRVFQVNGEVRRRVKAKVRRAPRLNQRSNCRLGLSWSNNELVPKMQGRGAGRGRQGLHAQCRRDTSTLKGQMWQEPDSRGPAIGRGHVVRYPIFPCPTTRAITCYRRLTFDACAVTEIEFGAILAVYIRTQLH